MLSGKSPADHLPSADWEQLEAIVAHFEEAWQSSSHPRLADYLPSEDDQCLAVLVEFDPQRHGVSPQGRHTYSRRSIPKPMPETGCCFRSRPTANHQGV